MKQILIVFLLAVVAVAVVACGAPPTPTLLPSPTLPFATVAPTKAPATPTTAPTVTPVPPTPAPPTATPTRTRAAVVATPKPAATATPAKPAAPTGSIAYHPLNSSGIDSVYVLNVGKNTTTQLVNIGPVMDLNTNVVPYAWSQDNSKFAYIFAGTQYASNVLKVSDSSGNTPPLSVYSSDERGGLSSPTWSPDGKRIAFARVTGNQPSWAIIIINADGTKCTNDQYECLLKQVPGEQYRGGLAWSKQGLLTVAFNITGKNDVYTMFSDGGNTRNLTNNPADDGTPALSPDGKLIAFTSDRDGRQQIYAMNADGSAVRRVSQGNVSDFSPTFSPDGKWIAFASTRNGATDIYMMDLNGNNVTQLTKTGGDHPTWSH